MNKNDKKLIYLTLFFTTFIFLIFSLMPSGNTAIVYKNGKTATKIDLNVDQTFFIEGFLGEVKIEVKDGKIRVVEETSPKHLCSRQGFISSVNESIICLPNKIVIEIVNDEKLDEIVK